MDIVLSQKTDAAGNAVPIYRRLYEQLSSKILRGELNGGSVLPPIRTVAAELGISVIPVKRAWEQLEREGLIVTAVGRGSFVAELSIQQMETKKHSIAYERLSEDIKSYRALGITKEEILGLVERHYSCPPRRS